MIETLTTERVIPLGTNSSDRPASETTERVIPLGTNSDYQRYLWVSPAEVSTQ